MEKPEFFRISYWIKHEKHKYSVAPTNVRAESVESKRLGVRLLPNSPQPPVNYGPGVYCAATETVLLGLINTDSGGGDLHPAIELKLIVWLPTTTELARAPLVIHGPPSIRHKAPAVTAAAGPILTITDPTCGE
jgi:hypothetical protein